MSIEVVNWFTKSNHGVVNPLFTGQSNKTVFSKCNEIKSLAKDRHAQKNKQHLIGYCYIG